MIEPAECHVSDRGSKQPPAEVEAWVIPLSGWVTSLELEWTGLQGTRRQVMTSVCSRIVLPSFSFMTMFRHPSHFLLSLCHSTLVRNCPCSRKNTSSAARWSHLLARAQPSLLIAPTQEGSQVKLLLRAHLSPAIGAWPLISQRAHLDKEHLAEGGKQIPLSLSTKLLCCKCWIHIGVSHCHTCYLLLTIVVCHRLLPHGVNSMIFPKNPIFCLYYPQLLNEHTHLSGHGTPLPTSQDVVLHLSTSRDMVLPLFMV